MIAGAGRTDGARGGREVTARLLRWYRRRGRALPWRRRPTPYRVWISEIMLQQTTVAAVEPYFNRFVRRFPGVAALAGARVEEVLAHWSGLGYYRRARNLHDAARRIVRLHGGRIPESLEALRALPGVGAYTAGAIRSIGFHRPAAAIDGNIARVLARLDAVSGDPVRAATRRAFEARALDLMGKASPSDFNQALMDLGATICTPRRPACGTCPIARHCRAFAEGDAASYPRPARRPAAVDVPIAAIAVLRGAGRRAEDRCLLVQRPEGGMRGLWDFPIADGVTREAVARAARRMGARVTGRAGVVRHVITRHRIRIDVHLAVLDRGGVPEGAGRPRALSGTLCLSEPKGRREGARDHPVRVGRARARWVALERVAGGSGAIAITATARKIARIVAEAR